MMWESTAVLPVPGAPDTYKLPGMFGLVCLARKLSITLYSLSRHTIRSGRAVWSACFARW